MSKTLTVAELIEVLKGYDPSLPVEIGMNQEYQCAVSRDMVEVYETYEGRKILQITDTPDFDYDDEYDGQPDEAQEWESFDPDC